MCFHSENRQIQSKPLSMEPINEALLLILKGAGVPAWLCFQQCLILLNSFKNNRERHCRHSLPSKWYQWASQMIMAGPRGQAHGAAHVSPERTNVVIYASQFVMGQKQFAAVSITKVNTRDGHTEPFWVVPSAKKLRSSLIAWLISLYDTAVCWHVYTGFLLSGAFG